MTERLFDATLRRRNFAVKPPVWFMRQAGRYHAHYQNIRQSHSFMEVCKSPTIACEATLGPVEDFGFDAGILFSDILFPLEAMGIGLEFDPGPKLAWYLETPADIARLRSGPDTARRMLGFQPQALELIRARLGAEKSLLGFVGAPLTLFNFAVKGTHKGNSEVVESGLADGRFGLFCGQLLDLLAENMVMQAEAGADAVAVFDTCAGDVSLELYAALVVPQLKVLLEKFKLRCPDVPLIYYSKLTDPAHWEHLRDLPIDCLGVDWRHDICDVLTQFGDRFAIQGNVDPQWLCLSTEVLQAKLWGLFSRVAALPRAKRQGWVCGLGHGILPTTPEVNVRAFLQVKDEVFR